MGKVPYLWHDYDTNGIIYLDLIFDVHHIPEELVPYMAILKNLLGRLDTTDYKYMDFTDEVNLYTGGIYSDLNVYSEANKATEYQVKFEIRMKTLEANLGKAVALSKSMMLHTLFRDEKRIYEILAQAKSRLQMELSESGHVISATRALSYYSRRAKYADLIQGISFYRVLEHIVADYENQKAGLIEKMTQLIEMIMQPGLLLVSCTCENEGFELVKRQAERICEGLYPYVAKEKIDISLPEKKK